MKLYLHAYNINNEPVGSVLKSWTADQLNGNLPFISSTEITVPNYTNITSMENWHLYGRDTLRDYQELRLAIRCEFYEKGWDNCTNIEKDLALLYYCNPDKGNNAQNMQMITYLMTVKGLSLNESKFALVDYWFNHWDKFVEDCPKRWRLAAKQTVLMLSFQEASALNVLLANTRDKYLTSGILGLDYGDHTDGIMDFIESTNSFSNSGMVQQNYNPVFGFPTLIQALKNELVGEYFWDEIKAIRDTLP